LTFRYAVPRYAKKNRWVNVFNCETINMSCSTSINILRLRCRKGKSDKSSGYSALSSRSMLYQSYHVEMLRQRNTNGDALEDLGKPNHILFWPSVEYQVHISSSMQTLPHSIGSIKIDLNCKERKQFGSRPRKRLTSFSNELISPKSQTKIMAMFASYSYSLSSIHYIH